MTPAERLRGYIGFLEAHHYDASEIAEIADHIEELTEALKEARLKLSGAGYDPIQACNEAERVIEKALSKAMKED